MKFCIDTGDVKKIREICEYYPVDGVSTNPSILAKTGRNPYEVLKEIREIIGQEGELFVQVISDKAEDMVEESKVIVRELGDQTLIKIPCVPEGFKAMKMLKKEGIRFIGTAIYTTMQGYLAAKCGAEYVAPYDDYMKKTKGHKFNMLVMKKELLDGYCSWLFDILFELESRLDITDYSAYDKRVYGFVSERLLDVWMITNNIRYKELPVVNMENQHWLKKGMSFLTRKFKKK